MPYDAVAGILILALVILFIRSADYAPFEKVVVLGVIAFSFLLRGHAVMVILLRTGVGIYLCLRMGIRGRSILSSRGTAS
jgi:hypothetical protein